METISEIAEQVASISARIKELEQEKFHLMDMLRCSWRLGELDEYKDEKGDVILDSLRVSSRSRTTWSYSPAVEALQEKEQHTGVAERKITTYICVTNVKSK